MRSDELNTELVPSSSAAEINRLHHAAQRSAGEALQMARRAGELLAEVKAKLAHGEFLPWLEANCDVGERQAQRYMRLAKNWEALTANTTSTSDLGRLGIDGALAMLAAPKESESDFDVEEFWGKFEVAWDTLVRPVGGLDEASAQKGKRAEKIVSAAFIVADRLTSTYHHEGAPAILRMIRECQDSNDNALARAYTAVLEAWQPTELSPKEHADALMAIGDPVFDEADSGNSDSSVGIPANHYRQLANTSADPVVRAQASFMAEIWDLAPGVRFTKTGMELPTGLSFENWREVGRLLASRMPEEMRRRP